MGKHGIPQRHEPRGSGAYLSKALPARIAYIHDKVVCLARGDVDDTIYVTPHEVTHGPFVEVARTARKHPQHAGNVVNNGLPIRAVWGPADVGKELL